MMDEELLIQRCQEGDQEAFRQLFRRYRGMVYNVAFRTMGEDAFVEDVVQEVFVNVYKSLPGYKARARFETWLYRVTVNVCLQRLRKKQVATVPLDDVPVVDRAPAPDRAAEQREMEAAVQSALLQLKPKHRMVVVLHDMEGLTEGEIGEIMRCPKGTVKSRLHYARGKLRELLRERLDYLH